MCWHTCTCSLSWFWMPDCQCNSRSYTCTINMAMEFRLHVHVYSWFINISHYIHKQLHVYARLSVIDIVHVFNKIPIHVHVPSSTIIELHFNPDS